MLRKGDMCRIRTLRENSSMGQGVKITEEKSVARLAYKECFKGSVERNMEPTLGQRRKYETHNVIKHDTTRPLPCKFL
jgi:hypothetical protein